MSILTSILAVCNILFLILVSIQVSDGKKSVRAAQASAEAAFSAIGSDRAWICHETLEFYPFNDSDVGGTLAKKGIAIKIVWKNAGRSPAVKVQCFAAPMIVNFEEDAIPDFKPTWDECQENPPIGPNGKIATGLIPFDEAALYGLLERRKAFIIYGSVIYRDIFATLVTRRSETCFRVTFGGYSLINGNSEPWWNVTAVGPQNTCT